MKKYFCEYCNKEVNTKVEHKKITVNYDYDDTKTGMPEVKKVPIITDVRTCCECGNDVYDQEIEDEIFRLAKKEQSKYSPEPTYLVNLSSEELYELVGFLKGEFDVCMEHVTEDGVFVLTDDGRDRLHMKLITSALIKFGLTIQNEDVEDPFEEVDERMYS